MGKDIRLEIELQGDESEMHSRVKWMGNSK